MRFQHFEEIMVLLRDENVSALEGLLLLMDETHREHDHGDEDLPPSLLGECFHESFRMTRSVSDNPFKRLSPTSHSVRRRNPCRPAAEKETYYACIICDGDECMGTYVEHVALSFYTTSWVACAHYSCMREYIVELLSTQ